MAHQHLRGPGKRKSVSEGRLYVNWIPTSETSKSVRGGMGMSAAAHLRKRILQTSLCTLPPWRTTMNLQQGRRTFSQTTSRHFTDAAFSGRRQEEVKKFETEICSDAQNIKHDDTRVVMVPQKQKELHGQVPSVSPGRSNNLLLEVQSWPGRFPRDKRQKYDKPARGKAMPTQDSTRCARSGHFFTLAVMTVVGLHDFVKVSISASLKSFLLIMCIEALQSTTNSRSSGLGFDAGRHQFSEA